MPTAVKRRYFELIRQGWSGSRAAAAVGVSLSCGSLWFIDAGSVRSTERSTVAGSSLTTLRRCAPGAPTGTSADEAQAGHWEGDLIVGAGQKSAIVTAVERKFRLTILAHLPRGHTAQSVGDR
jgi:hypothetical protein